MPLADAKQRAYDSEWAHHADARHAARRHTADGRMIAQQDRRLQRAAEHVDWMGRAIGAAAGGGGGASRRGSVGSAEDIDL